MVIMMMYLLDMLCVWFVVIGLVVKGLFVDFVSFVRSRGVLSLYSGLSFMFIGIILYGGILFVMFEMLKVMYIK